MFPVFSLVLDKDVKAVVAMLYPELYKDLLKVRSFFHSYSFQISACDFEVNKYETDFIFIFSALSFLGKAVIL